MAKVIKTLGIEGDISFDCINTFKTENYIGIYNHTDDEFILLPYSDCELNMMRISSFDDLQELDDEVYSICDEHIEEVFEDGNYTMSLETVR